MELDLITAIREYNNMKDRRIGITTPKNKIYITDLPKIYMWLNTNNHSLLITKADGTEIFSSYKAEIDTKIKRDKDLLIIEFEVLYESRIKYLVKLISSNQ